MPVLGIMVDAGVEPIQLAELRWRIAQLDAFDVDRRGLATVVREVFQAAGRTAEVDATDRWLVNAPLSE